MLELPSVDFVLKSLSQFEDLCIDLIQWNLILSRNHFKEALVDAAEDNLDII